MTTHSPHRWQNHSDSKLPWAAWYIHQTRIHQHSLGRLLLKSWSRNVFPTFNWANVMPSPCTTTSRKQLPAQTRADGWEGDRPVTLGPASAHWSAKEDRHRSGCDRTDDRI